MTYQHAPTYEEWYRQVGGDKLPAHVVGPDNYVTAIQAVMVLSTIPKIGSPSRRRPLRDSLRGIGFRHRGYMCHEVWLWALRQAGFTVTDPSLPRPNMPAKWVRWLNDGCTRFGLNLDKAPAGFMEAAAEAREWGKQFPCEPRTDPPFEELAPVTG